MSGFVGKRANGDNTYGHGIICKNCVVRKVSEAESSVQYVRIGTFVQVHSIREEDVFFCIVRNDMQVETDELVCTKADVIHVPENLWRPLFPVEQSARLSLVEDKKVSESMGNISVGHRVHVLGPDNKVICTGSVAFRNSILRLGVGVYFGLKVESSKDNLQAIIKNTSLLEPGTKGFPHGCDIVVAVDKICPINMHRNKEKLIHRYDNEFQRQLLKSSDAESINGTSYKSMIVLNLRDKVSNNTKKVHQINHPGAESNQNQYSNKKIINSDNPLAVGDKIVYLHGDTPEIGVVRWMGNIKNSLKIGVEFDNPIGSGSGTVDGIELFRTKLHHALIVPPLALIKLSDYMMNNTNDTFQFKNDINFNNNNNNYNNLKLNDLCCDNKTANEKKHHQIVKSNSHQCLKHPERTLYCEEPFQSKEDAFPRKSDSVNAEIKMQNICEMQSQRNCRSFDFAKPSERKSSYQRQCNSMDNDLIQGKESKSHINSHIPNSAGQKTPSQNLFGFMEPNWSKHDRSHNSCKEDKLLKTLDDDLFTSFKNIPDPAKEELLNIHFEKDVWNCHYSEHSSSSESITNIYDTPKASPSFVPEDLGQGSLVELIFKGEPHYGVIRWIGTIPEDAHRDSRDPPRLIAGIEMEDEENGFTDGTFNNKRYFQCNPKKALFVPLSKCKKDSRFSDEIHKQSLPATINYGQIDCPAVEGTIPPINTKGDIKTICGKNRGIQGHHNSCYLDATLFSMFAFTCVFDSLLYRPPTKHDILQYVEVQRVLREEIVNPLRKNLYVRADRVMKLRTLLEKLSSVSGLTSEEKDPEEFLNSLLAQILKAEPFLKLSSGQEAFHYQLFVEKDERLTFPSVQQLFEQSFVTSDIKLKEVPPCLIIQMPRFGKSFKMYSKILPPQLLDVTDIIENSPRQCTVCGKSAVYECKDCFGQAGIGNGLESISYCRKCLETAHNHHCRTRHNYRTLSVPVEFSELEEHCIIPRVYMELFAVVCIETSHYVAFVKCGSGSDAPWCFFDSMADRKGEQNGYNIPEMVPCPDLPYWLSEDGAKTLNEMRDDRHLPEHAKRLFSDAYMCMYQSPDMMMYR